ncbi:MAG: cytochrome d ubiquinol oxidase subunit II [Pseudomonadota bacterium]
MLLDYETLKLIWWGLIGALLIGFAITGGMDLGVACLLPWVGKADEDRRILLNSIGPTWEGNQVWLVTAGGALFAAWPFAYAAAFSGFYLAMLLVLLALILRPPGIDYRSKLPSKQWRNTWDAALFISGFLPALLFGVALGNLLLGVSFHFDDTLRIVNTGAFIDLLHPFALGAGLVSVAMLCMQGGLFIQMKTQGVLQQRARTAVLCSGTLFIVLFCATGIASHFLDGYLIVSMPDSGSSFAPTEKIVEHVSQGMLSNFRTYPLLLIAPVLAFLACALAMVAAKAYWPFVGLVCSSICCASVLATMAFALFPFVMPSISQPNHSLTIWDTVSSHRTLMYMLVAVAVFLPIVLAYTTWVFSIVRGKVTGQTINSTESY